ncbi:hypothetical protein [Stenotrophomonas sp. 1337]|uniref:hypothetical protein n=1 Tax=Stenotrophomonas sp. 1337 TaxID=2817757 RepID=UPI00285FC29F|nr:hypothetical protein [Stenotrophomonas sp. 1337]MDR6695476.1 hypothetical protein [Stenotrophomonas sp. 1337]
MGSKNIPSGIGQQGVVILSNKDINIISSLAQNSSIPAKDFDKYATRFGASDAAKTVLRYLSDVSAVASNPYDVEAKRIAIFFRDWSLGVGGSGLE